MGRPNRALCGIVLGLAVLVGCAKKPKTDENASAQAQPAPNPAAVQPGQEQPGTKGPPMGRATGAYTAEGPVPLPAPGTGGPKLDGGTVPSGTGGPVELVQCRFDKVEAALSAAKGKVVLV